MEESLLISVIIPVYNVEKYLEQCLDSVVNQSYMNLEIICIDDCSTDNSLEIAENFAKKDSRIKIFKNNSNLGVGSARNIGLKNAKGEYIHFLDPDDWLEKNAYEKLIKSVYKEGMPEVVRFLYKIINCENNKNVLLEYKEQSLLNCSINPLLDFRSLKKWTSSSWVMFIRRDLIQDKELFFNNHRCFEDVVYSVRLFLAAKKIVFIDECLLNYRQHRKNSLLSKRLYYLMNLQENAQWCNAYSKDLPEALRVGIKNYVYYFLVENALDSYYYGITGFNKIKKIFSEALDLADFRENSVYSLPKEYYIIVDKVLKYNSIKFFFSYKVRRFIRKKFPKQTELYFKIKKRMKEAFRL